jgi:hypothetical protein
MRPFIRTIRSAIFFYAWVYKLQVDWKRRAVAPGIVPSAINNLYFAAGGCGPSPKTRAIGKRVENKDTVLIYARCIASPASEAGAPQLINLRERVTTITSHRGRNCAIGGGHRLTGPAKANSFIEQFLRQRHSVRGVSGGCGTQQHQQYSQDNA